MKTGFAVCGIAALVALGGQASATTLQAESRGERSQVLSCFYECKPFLPGTPNLGFLWKEATTVMLTNVSQAPALATVVFLDDDENFIARTEVHLSPFDLDELYVCRTLWVGGVRPPPDVGLIEVVVRGTAAAPLDRVYGWVKNLAGILNGLQPEPFKGNQRVTGIGKTECRVTPPSVTTPEIIDGKLANADPIPPFVDPLLIEGTAEAGN